MDGEGSPSLGGFLSGRLLRIFTCIRTLPGRGGARTSSIGVWSVQESSLHINLLEVKALFLALQSFQEMVTGHHVTAMCDNSTVVAYINRQLLQWTECFDIQLEARYLPGQSNVLADLLSRRDQVIGSKWSLHPPGGKSTPLCLGFSVTGLVRDSPQREASPVLLPSPGSPGYLRGCVPTSMGQPGRIRFSSLSPGQEGRGSGQRDPKFLHDSGHPSLAGEGVVCGPPPSADPTTSGATPVGPAASAAPLQLLPPGCPCIEPSRVATLQRLLRKSGVSRGAALEMSGCIRESTARLYQAKWLSFCGWCRRRGTAPVNATVPLIVDFFIHLRRDWGLSVSAIKGYRATLNSVLTLKGLDLATSRELSMLSRSFSRSARPGELRPPAWDFALVLQSRTGPPYELLRTVDERFLAHKTLFILALASAKRVGELHALSFHVSHSEGWSEASFRFVPGFVAKTQDASSHDPRFEGFCVPTLPKSSTNPNFRLLCPVRAVRCYLARTAPHRRQCERLFVTSGRLKKEISKNKWPRSVVVSVLTSHVRGAGFDFRPG